MQVKSLISLITFVLFSGLLLAPAHASDWISLRQLNAKIKAMKRAGKMPVSMKCRADPSKKLFKPQIKVQWRDSISNKEWTIYAYKGQLDFRPGPPEQWNQWRRVYKAALKVGNGGSLFRCSLFHKK